MIDSGKSPSDAVESNHSAESLPSGTGNAVGVPRRHWYVAIVRNNTEKAVAERLEAEGYDCYLPTQRKLRIWSNGKKKYIDRVVIPAVIFMRVTESERRKAVYLPYILRFMTNKAGENANRVGKPLAIIPEVQIETLRFMLRQSSTEVSVGAEYRKGEKVRVIRGDLRGLEGEVLESDGKSELIVRIDIFGCARLTISADDLTHI